ncbi:MAG TPA: SMC-Scp complex subunit ScpB [Cyclobacteriaceae bacterium]|jgi:segregation and condensation protein B|nr:SMC-Scp complex subunit ScpB [Cyclobacteriaceae bacterium]
MELESKIEGLLFYKGEDVPVKKLAELFNVSIEEIEEALKKLDQSLVGRGIVIVRRGDTVVLGIAKELSSLIESIRKDEITKELSKAALETLSIILYKNGIARNEIDYIRGVNSSFILRNLLVRGLVERIVDPKDSRKVLYRPTFDTLSYMGVTKIEDLPNYKAVVAQLEEAMVEVHSND